MIKKRVTLDRDTVIICLTALLSKMEEWKRDVKEYKENGGGNTDLTKMYESTIEEYQKAYNKLYRINWL